MSDLTPYGGDNWENLSDKTAKDINRVLKTLANALDMGRLKQGELLSHMNDDRRYIELVNPDTGENFSTFKEYCETELGMALRTARYRISVYDKLINKLKIPTDQIELIGWSKAALIAPQADNVSIGHWLEEAKEKSYRALRMKIQSIRSPVITEDGEERVVLNKNIFMFTDDQQENIEAALDNASRLCSHRNKSRLIDFICLQYNADAVFAVGSSNMASQLEWFIQRMEDTFKIKLIVEEDE